MNIIFSPFLEVPGEGLSCVCLTHGHSRAVLETVSKIFCLIVLHTDPAPDSQRWPLGHTLLPCDQKSFQ